MNPDQRAFLKRRAIHQRAAAVVSYLLFLAASANAADVILEVASPLRPAAGGIMGITTALELDPAAYETLKDARQARLTGFVLDAQRTVTLKVEQFDVLAPGAVLVAAGDGGDVQTPRPDVVLLRGEVPGHAGSSVFLALSPHGTQGIVRAAGPRGDQTWVISTPPAGRGQTVIYNLRTLPEGALRWTDFQCGIRDVAQGGMTHAPRGGNTAGDGPPPCRRVQVAIETDWEYTLRFGGDVAAAQAYIVTLLGAVSEIYVRDINTHLEVVYARVWETPADPWISTNIAARLEEARLYWNLNMTHVDRNITHVLSGLRAGAGGVAWMGQVCGGPLAYAISGYINGSFPYPLVNNHEQNWDVKVVAHEIGHNFNAPHTHEMSPPVDRCGVGNCSQAAEGTIMSYCHTCWGGMSNISLDLHVRITTEHMLPYLASLACGLEVVPAYVSNPPPPRSAYEGQRVQFSVVAGGSGPHTYRWQHNGADLADGGNISGAQSAVLTIDPVSSDDAGQYSVRIANTCGQATSAAALLTILEPCYANCTLNTQPPLLTVNDFLCFIDEFAAAQGLPVQQQIEHYANCDQNTAPPILTINDFLCFIDHFAAGCP